MTGQSRPLLLTGDPDLLDDLLGLASAVGIAADVAPTASLAGPLWMTAPLVLVGSDLAHTLAPARLAPRDDVLVVSRDPDDHGGVAERAGAGGLIRLPAEEAFLLDRLADLHEPAARARVLGVVPGRGGAGASTLAVGLALTAATAGQPAWLVDLDPLGGGADTGMGAELAGGSRWADLTTLTGRLSHAALRRAVPDVHGVAVLAADPRGTDEPAADAVRAVLAAARRGGGTVVLDLPRHPAAGRPEGVAVTDDLLVVVPAEVRAVVATRRLLTDLDGYGAPPRVVVRAVPDGLPPAEVVRALELPLAGMVVDDPAVRVAGMTGDAPSIIRGTALGQLCGTLLSATGTTWVAA